MKVNELFDSNGDGGKPRKNPTGWWTAYNRSGVWEASEGQFESKKDAEEQAAYDKEDGDNTRVIYGELIGGDGGREIKRLTPPTNEAIERNPKLGYRDDGGKRFPIGTSKEWFSTFGATDQHISQARKIVLQSPEYRKLKELGMVDSSTDRHGKIGSMKFVGQSVPGSKRTHHNMTYTVQGHGKIDGGALSQGPITTPKPRIVPGDPVGSIVKSMTASMAKLASTVEKRKKRDQKAHDADLKRRTGGGTMRKA